MAADAPTTPEPQAYTYIGTKIVRAYPERNERRGLHGADGYHVIYPDGYESWSPKDVFEAAYRRVLDGEAALVRGDG